VFANARAAGSAFVGGVALRDGGSGKDWEIARLPLDTPVSDQTRVSYAAQISAVGGETQLHVDVDSIDSAAERMRWRLGYPEKQADLAKLTEERKGVVKRWLGYWSGAAIPDADDVAVPDPTVDVAAPLRMSGDIRWSPDVQVVGGRILVPALPPTEFVHNPFVAEQRQHALWLMGGDYELRATWRIPAGFRAAPIDDRAGDGPGGLAYRVSSATDANGTIVATRLVVHEPIVLAASDYAGVRAFFEGLQRDATRPLLLER
jgi:hypothetical protein